MDAETLENRLLLEAATRTEDALTRPRPDGRQNPNACWRYDEERRYGPFYSGDWLPDETATDAGRQRVLRAIHRLHSNGLLDIFTGTGKRLTNLRLTPAGWQVVEALRGIEAAK